MAAGDRRVWRNGGRVRGSLVGVTDWKVRSPLVMTLERLWRPFRAWGFCWDFPGAMPQAGIGCPFGPRGWLARDGRVGERACSEKGSHHAKTPRREGHGRRGVMGF